MIIGFLDFLRSNSSICWLFSSK